MIPLIKEIWAERSTKIGVAVLVLVWIGAIVASFLVPAEMWPQVKEALTLPVGLANGGALLAIFVREKRPPCEGDQP